MTEPPLSLAERAELYLHSGNPLLAALFFQKAAHEAGGSPHAANLYERAKKAGLEHVELMQANSNQQMNTKNIPTNNEAMGDRQFLRCDFLGAAEQYRRAGQESGDHAIEAHFNARANKALEIHDAMMKASAPKLTGPSHLNLYTAAKKLLNYYRGGATIKEKADAWSELNAALFDCENPK